MRTGVNESVAGTRVMFVSAASPTPCLLALLVDAIWLVGAATSGLRQCPLVFWGVNRGVSGVRPEWPKGWRVVLLWCMLALAPGAAGK